MAQSQPSSRARCLWPGSPVWGARGPMRGCLSSMTTSLPRSRWGSQLAKEIAKRKHSGYKVCFRKRPPGRRLPDAVFWHQTRRLGCEDFLEAFDHAQVDVFEAAFPHRHGSSLCGPRSAEGLPGHQFTGMIVFMGFFYTFGTASVQKSKKKISKILFLRFLKIRWLTPSTCFIYPARGWFLWGSSPGTFSVNWCLQSIFLWVMWLTLPHCILGRMTFYFLPIFTAPRPQHSGGNPWQHRGRSHCPAAVQEVPGSEPWRWVRRS